MPIEFSRCGPAIEQSDIVRLEVHLDTRLPASLKTHYQRCNGGMPALDWYPMSGGYEPIWVQEFLPIGTQRGDAPTIQSVYASVVGKAGYLEHFIPFAVDPGGNLFCVDVSDGSVHYWLTDTFDATLTDAQLRRKADRRLTDSFEQFVSTLVSEDDAFN